MKSNNRKNEEKNGSNKHWRSDSRKKCQHEIVFDSGYNGYKDIYKCKKCGVQAVVEWLDEK